MFLLDSRLPKTKTPQQPKEGHTLYQVGIQGAWALRPSPLTSQGPHLALSTSELTHTCTHMYSHTLLGSTLYARRARGPHHMLSKWRGMKRLLCSREGECK